MPLNGSQRSDYLLANFPRVITLLPIAPIIHLSLFFEALYPLSDGFFLRGSSSTASVPSSPSETASILADVVAFFPAFPRKFKPSGPWFLPELRILAQTEAFFREEDEVREEDLEVDLGEEDEEVASFLNGTK